MNKNNIAEEFEKTFIEKLKKNVTVQSSEAHKDLVICIDKAAPAERKDFVIIREEALKKGYDVEEDVDQKTTQDEGDLPEQMYFYLLRPYSDSKSK